MNAKSLNKICLIIQNIARAYVIFNFIGAEETGEASTVTTNDESQNPFDNGELYTYK